MVEYTDTVLDIYFLNVYMFVYFMLSCNLGFSAFLYYMYCRRVVRLENMVNYLIGKVERTDRTSESESESESENENESESESESETEHNPNTKVYYEGDNAMVDSNELRVIGESIRNFIRKSYSDTILTKNQPTVVPTNVVETDKFSFTNY